MTQPTYEILALPRRNGLERMIQGWVTCEALADGPDHIIPGHDPEVLHRFPKLEGDADTVLLHLPPTD